MKCHPIFPLIFAGILLAAPPALARDHGPAITITTHLGVPFPRIDHRSPAVVVVREPAWRERVVVVDRGSHHGYRDHDRGDRSCGERGSKRERVYERVYDDRRHGRRELRRGERVVLVDRSRGRWEE